MRDVRNPISDVRCPICDIQCPFAECLIWCPMYDVRLGVMFLLLFFFFIKKKKNSTYEVYEVINDEQRVR